MRQLILIHGPCGAGKTYLAAELAGKVWPKAAVLEEHHYGDAPTDHLIPKHRFSRARWRINSGGDVVALDSPHAEMLRGVESIILTAREQGLRKANLICAQRGGRLVEIRLHSLTGEEITARLAADTKAS